MNVHLQYIPSHHNLTEGSSMYHHTLVNICCLHWYVCAFANGINGNEISHFNDVMMCRTYPQELVQICFE